MEVEAVITHFVRPAYTRFLRKKNNLRESLYTTPKLMQALI